MNSEKNVLTVAPQLLGESKSDSWAGEFARSVVWGGLQSPIPGATQLVDKALGTDLKQRVQFMDAPNEADAKAFSAKWHARQLGTMVGMAVPFLLLHKGVSACVSLRLGKIEHDAAVSVLTRRVVAESAATGALFDGVFHPRGALDLFLELPQHLRNKGIVCS